jgi:hypothetical protein
MFSASTKAASGTVPATPDPQFNYVTMLLHGDGTNGAQNNTFLDSSTNNFTITRNGNTTQGSFSPYGSNWSNYFDGVGDQLQGPTNNAAFQFGTGDFTVECWLYQTARNSYPSILEIDNHVNSGGILFYAGTTGGDIGAYNGTTGFLGTATAPPLNTWNHIAWVRNSGVFKIYVNGVGNAGVSFSADLNTSPTVCVGGVRSLAAPYDVSGNISNLRLVKGTAVYTSNFTPPTAPLSAISGTSFLICQSNRFIDSSVNNFPITLQGTPSVQRFNPFGTTTAYSTSVIGGSGYFDGSGDYLSLASNAAFGFGTGDFTVEFWLYVNSISSYQTVVATRAGGSVTDLWTIGFDSGGSTYLYSNTFYGQTANGVIKTGSWIHVAIVKNSSTIKTYVNGTQSGSSSSNSQNFITAPLGVGANTDGSETMNGYISNLRIVKGTAVYTANFTPPTAPVTAISGTSLLTNFTNGAIFDNAMMNDLETAGNAQISTSVVKYGTGSISGFNASTSQVISYSGANVGNFGAGNFTVECWINVNSSNNGGGVFTQASSGGAANTSWGFFLGYTTSTSIDFYVSDGSTYFANTGGGIANDNAWHHIAFSRSGSSGRLFLDGTQVGSTLSLGTTALGNGTKQINIGGQGAQTLMTQGYIDDIRITKGYARYTANFTPPIVAFPNIGPY